MPFAVTANRLDDGRVVFRSPDGGWTPDLATAGLADSEALAAPALEAANRDAANEIIVEPYVIEIAVADGKRRPARLREAIRAFGPTIAYAPEAAN